MKRVLGIIIFSLIQYVMVNPALSYTEPPYIPVTKPNPTAVKTICNSGCDFSTIEDADRAAQPGWKFRIKAGSYAPTSWDSSGTAGHEIVIEAFGDGDAIIDVNGTDRFILNGSYIIFEGGANRQLIFDGSGQTSGAKTIYPDFYTSHNTFTRCIIRNTGRSQSGPPYTDWSTCNIQGRGDYFRVLNCIIEGGAAVGYYGEDGDFHEIRNNIVRNNGGTGIQYNPHETNPLVSNDEVTISGNLIYGNGFQFEAIRPGITLASSTNRLYDVYIYNNFIWGNKTCGIKKENDPVSSNVRVWNNTVYNNVDNGFWFKSGGSMDIRNNIVVNNGPDSWSNWAVGPYDSNASNNIVTMPAFASTSVSSPDFLKLSASATTAVNQGANLSQTAVTMDIFGISRIANSPYDIGAHEYTNSSGSNGSLQNITTLQVVSSQQTP